MLVGLLGLHKKTILAPAISRLKASASTLKFRVKLDEFRRFTSLSDCAFVLAESWRWNQGYFAFFEESLSEQVHEFRGAVPDDNVVFADAAEVAGDGLPKRVGV